jgi:hypothetical protein
LGDGEGRQADDKTKVGEWLKVVLLYFLSDAWVEDTHTHARAFVSVALCLLCRARELLEKLDQANSNIARSAEEIQLLQSQVKSLQSQVRILGAKAPREITKAIEDLELARNRTTQEQERCARENRRLREQDEKQRELQDNLEQQQEKLKARKTLLNTLSRRNLKIKGLLAQHRELTAQIKQANQRSLEWENAFAALEEQCEELRAEHINLLRRRPVFVSGKRGGQTLSPSYVLQMMMLTSVPGVSFRAGPEIIKALLGEEGRYAARKDSFAKAGVAMHRLATVLSLVFALMAAPHAEVADGMSTDGRAKFVGSTFAAHGVKATVTGARRTVSGTAKAGYEDWVAAYTEAEAMLKDFENENPDADLRLLWEDVTGPLPEGKALSDMNWMDKKESVVGDNANTQMKQSKLMLELLAHRRERQGMPELGIKEAVGCCNHKMNLVMDDGASALSKAFISLDWTGAKFTVTTLMRTLGKCFHATEKGRDHRGLADALKRTLGRATTLPRMVGNRFFIYYEAALAAVYEWAEMEKTAQNFCSKSPDKVNKLIRGAFNIVSSQEVKDTLVTMACVWVRWGWWMRYACNKEGELKDEEKKNGLKFDDFRKTVQEARAALVAIAADGKQLTANGRLFTNATLQTAWSKAAGRPTMKKQLTALDQLLGDDCKARRERVWAKAKIWAKGALGEFDKQFAGYLQGKGEFSKEEEDVVRKSPRVSDQ